MTFNKLDASNLIQVGTGGDKTEQMMYFPSTRVLSACALSVWDHCYSTKEDGL